MKYENIKVLQSRVENEQEDHSVLENLVQPKKFKNSFNSDSNNGKKVQEITKIEE